MSGTYASECHEGGRKHALRIGVIAGLLLLFPVLGQALPRQSPVPDRWDGRGHNLLLVGSDTLRLRLLIPLAVAYWGCTGCWRSRF